MKLSPNADDLWLKVMQILVHTPVVNCNQDIRKKRVVVDGSQNESLNSSNVHQNKNDEYMKNLIEYFKSDFSPLSSDKKLPLKLRNLVKEKF